MPSSRSLRFAVGTSLISTLALAGGCNKTKQTSNVAPHEEPHTNVAPQEEPQPEPQPEPDPTVSNPGPVEEPVAPDTTIVNVAPQPEPKPH